MKGLDTTSRKGYWPFRSKGRPVLYDVFAKNGSVFIVLSTKIDVCDDCGPYSKWANASWSCSFDSVSTVPASIHSHKHSRTLIVQCDYPEAGTNAENQIRTMNITIQENGRTHVYERVAFCQYPAQHSNDALSKTQQSHAVSLAACTMVKSDLVRFSLPYNISVLEWIAYHKLQGFEHFYVYANEDPAPLRRLLAPYIAEGLVEVVDWQWPTPGFQHQEAQINSCVYRYRGLTRWAAFLDIDEFLQPLAPGDTVRAVVARNDAAAAAAAAALRVASLWFFHCEGCNVTDDPLQTRKFTFRSRDASWPRSKLIVRPERVAMQFVHTIADREAMVALDPYTELRLNHYKNRVEGFLPDASMLRYSAAIEAEMARVARLRGA